MAEYLLTGARAVVKIDPSLQPAEVAALADAGLTAYHAVKKAVPLLPPGSRAVIIGAGGLGPIGIQSLAALTAAEMIVVDAAEPALDLARSIGAEHTVLADGSQVEQVMELTDGHGAEVVLDFVGEQGAEGRRLGVDARRRLALRHRVRRDGPDTDARHHLDRAQHHRQPRGLLQRAR